MKILRRRGTPETEEAPVRTPEEDRWLRRRSARQAEATRRTEAETVTRPPREPVPAPRPEEYSVMVPRTRTSAVAVFGVMVGLSSVYLALTGQLSPAAIVAGLVGVVLAAGGFAATARPDVSGRWVTLLGLLLSLGGLLLGLAGVTGVIPELAPEVDGVQRARDWWDTVTARI